MHSRLYKFLNDNNVIYHLQLSFREKHSTSFELIHLTETIKEALDQGKFVVFLLICKKPLTQNKFVVFLLICKKPLTRLMITF